MSLSFGSQGFEMYRQKMRRVFPDATSAIAWLNAPHDALKGRSPAYVLTVGGVMGADLVLALVDRMPGVAQLTEQDR